jgi:hypothetical protein
MRILPHRIYLMSLQGRKTLHGRALPTKEEALTGLRKLSGEDFGEDAVQWANWLRRNWRKCYRRSAASSEETP